MASGQILCFLPMLIFLAALPCIQAFASPQLGLRLRSNMHQHTDWQGRSRMHMNMAVLGSMDPSLTAAREALLSSIKSLPKDGVGATEEQRMDIAAKLEELIARNPVESPAQALLDSPEAFWKGTPYSIIYTNSSNWGSTGKIGPFVGDKWQQFLAVVDVGGQKRGMFTNNLKLGPLRAENKNYCVVKSPSKVDVLFEYIKVSLFGVQVSNQDFTQVAKPPKGSWTIKYMDEGMKILYTNAGSIEVLYREYK